MDATLHGQKRQAAPNECVFPARPDGESNAPEQIDGKREKGGAAFLSQPPCPRANPQSHSPPSQTPLPQSQSQSPCTLHHPRTKHRTSVSSARLTRVSGRQRTHLRLLRVHRVHAPRQSTRSHSTHSRVRHLKHFQGAPVPRQGQRASPRHPGRATASRSVLQEIKRAFAGGRLHRGSTMAAIGGARPTAVPCRTEIPRPAAGTPSATRNTGASRRACFFNIQLARRRALRTFLSSRRHRQHLGIRTRRLHRACVP